jgi:hypothetical protein
MDAAIFEIDFSRRGSNTVQMTQYVAFSIFDFQF